jgi:hypothetical protein
VIFNHGHVGHAGNDDQAGTGHLLRDKRTLFGSGSRIEFARAPSVIVFVTL